MEQGSVKKAMWDTKAWNFWFGLFSQTFYFVHLHFLSCVLRLHEPHAEQFEDLLIDYRN